MMCTFLQINWTQAVNQYKGFKRAASKRGLDASDCTGARKKQYVEAEDVVVIDDDDGMMDAFAGAAAGAGRIDGVGAGVVAGAAGGAGMGAGEGIRSEAVDAGMDDAAGAAAGEDAVAEVADVVPLLAGAGADSAAGAGMDAEDVAGAAGGDAACFDEVSAMQQLCDLLRRPLADGKSKFSHTSPSFQEWVCALLDCWKGEDGAWMRKILCVRAFSA